MRKALRILFVLVCGLIVGAACFGIWLAGYLMIGKALFGNIAYGEGGGWLGTLYVNNPLKEGLGFGGIIGALTGLIAGLWMNFVKVTGYRRGALIGILALEILIFIVYLLFVEPSLIDFFLNLIGQNLSWLLRISAIFVVPAAITGFTLSVIVGRVRRVRP